MQGLRHSARIATALLAILPALPLLHAVAASAAGAWSLRAWHDLASDSQTVRAWCLSLGSGLVSALLATAVAAWVLRHAFATPGWNRMVRLLAPMLAVPHAAFAIGLALLIAPSGWLLRALSPWATGFSVPPPWTLTQDPWALGLITVLVAKEVPFLLWAAASHLGRPDVALRLARELQVARSMGYAPGAAWWRVAWPQLRPRLRWPLLAILAYAMTVVDVALVIGPGTPPTLAVLAWGWLLDADATTNAQGAAAAWLLAGTLGLTAALIELLTRTGPWRARWTCGQRGRAGAGPRARHGGSTLFGMVGLAYAGVLLALAMGSVAGVWTFPALIPRTWTSAAWEAVLGSGHTLGTTLTLGLSSSAAALAWCVAWLECAPPGWDARLRPVLYLTLVLPAVLWVPGLHATALWMGIDATWPGLWLAHSLACVPYVLITLAPAYGGFDPRYRLVSASLGHGHARFLWAVKWPLLRAALAAAAAVGLAVSVAQYLPTLFIGAGRFSTVTTEAVTLAAGGQRSLSAAYAWLQWLLPALGFLLAAVAGRPRRFRAAP